jgi:hypothetical protein
MHGEDKRARPPVHARKTEKLQKHSKATMKRPTKMGFK